MSTKILDKATVVVKPELCKGCGLCISVCPVEVLHFNKNFNTKGYFFADYAGEGCTGCGICFYACPEPEAIVVWKKRAVVPEDFNPSKYQEPGVNPIEEMEDE
jgi:NAD-dependent dihydropyrimidine dehydrogenase PreA subunit